MTVAALLICVIILIAFLGVSTVLLARYFLKIMVEFKTILFEISRSIE